MGCAWHLTEWSLMGVDAENLLADNPNKADEGSAKWSHSCSLCSGERKIGRLTISKG